MEIRRLILGVILLTALVAVCAMRAYGLGERIDVVGLFKGKALVTIDGQQRLLRAGETSPEGVKLLSASSKQAVLEIDGEQRTFGLDQGIGSSFQGPEQPSVRIWPTPDRMYLSVGSINGFPVDFVVDTGATLISMNSNEARRLGIDYRMVGEKGMSSTASGMSKIYIVQLDRVRLGEIELRNVKGAVHEGNYPSVVLLGMSFLSRLEMRHEGEMLELRRKF